MKLNVIRQKFSSLLRFENHKLLSLGLTLLCSFMIAVTMERVYSVGRTYIFATIRGFLSGSGSLNLFPEVSLMTVYRTVILFCIAFFLLLHIIVKIKVFYDIVFRYRYLIAVAVFLVLVANKINFSSVAMYDYHIQPGLGSEFIEPVFGQGRPIRSDEWLVTTPIQLSAQYPPDPYGNINMIARGTATENMPNIGDAALRAVILNDSSIIRSTLET